MTLTKCYVILLDTGNHLRKKHVSKFRGFDVKYFTLLFFRLDIRVRKGPLKMCVTSLKPNLILMLANVGNSFKTMKAIVFKPNFDAVSPG